MQPNVHSTSESNRVKALRTRSPLLDLLSALSLDMSHGKQFTLYTNVGGPNGW